MPIPLSYICSFPDFDETVVGIIAADPREAAELATAWWERDIEDYRVIQGEETLRIDVKGEQDVSLWEVLGEGGRYAAKAMTQRED